MLLNVFQCIRQPHSRELLGKNVNSTKKLHRPLLTHSISHRTFSTHGTNLAPNQGPYRRQPIDRCFSPSLFPSLPLSLKSVRVNKNSLLICLNHITFIYILIIYKFSRKLSFSNTTLCK